MGRTCGWLPSTVAKNPNPASRTISMASSLFIRSLLFKLVCSDAVLVVQSHQLGTYRNRDLFRRLGAEVNAHGDVHTLQIFLLNAFFQQTFEEFHFFRLARNNTDIGGL